ncbi:MAG: hypothetical protein F6K11_15025 [Leptolyngbya sp. SIO3F4]|nr:hypothetical protein [Leptolyngbya sp. SIO3F4]
MFLVKSVKRKYRDAAFQRGAIRIGTINYYRGIEDATRQDGEEGLGHIVWNGKLLSAEHHNRIFTPVDKVTLNDGWSIKNNGVPIHGSYPKFNAYTFCYSEVKDTREIPLTSGGKATHYYFIKDLPKFIQIVSKALMSVASKMIETYAEPSEAARLIRNLKVLDATYRINYSDQPKYRVVNESNVERFDPMLMHPQDFFQKSTIYRYEREVRTIWLFFVHDVRGKRQLLSIPHPDEKYVDLELGRLPISKKRCKNRHKIKTSPLKPINA